MCVCVCVCSEKCYSALCKYIPILECHKPLFHTGRRIG